MREVQTLEMEFFLINPPTSNLKPQEPTTKHNLHTPNPHLKLQTSSSSLLLSSLELSDIHVYKP